MNHTIVITPRLVNNVIASVIYNSYVFGFADLSAALKAFPVRVNFRDGGANGGRIASMGAAANLPGGRRDGQLQVVDDVSYMAGRHSLKAGFGFRYNRDSDLGESGYVSFGAFFFANLREFASGALNESWYQQRFTNTPVMHLRLYNLGVYVQDEWAVSAHLKITGTVRFQRTGNPYCSDHCFARLVRPFPMIDKGLSIPYNRSIETGLAHAFYRIEPVIPQPRVGLTYNPSWSRSTVLRGGVGVFSDLYPAFFSGIFGANAPNVFSPVIQTGLLAGGGAGSAPAIAAASAEAFQTQFARGATLDQLQQAVSPAPFGPPSYYSVPATLRSPKYIEWSFEIQRELGAKNVLTLRYAGNHGYDIFMTNEAVNAYASPDAFPNGFSGLPPAAPDPRFAVVNQLQNTGYSNYNGLTVWFRRAFGHGFQGQISYTWSHALDTLSNGGLSRFGYDSAVTQINPNNAGALNYSSADYDVRHNITGDFIWELPVKPGNRLLKAAFGGWSVASRLNLHSGRPFSVFNYALSNELSGSFGGVVLADVVNPNIATTCGPSAVDRPCFSASEFVPAAAQGDLGNLPRNSFRGPGFFNIDSSVYKAFAIGDRMRLMLGASAYNVLNHVNFADPNNDVSQPGLGLITFTGTNPSGPYGNYGGPPARALVVTGRFYF